MITVLFCTPEMKEGRKEGRMEGRKEIRKHWLQRKEKKITDELQHCRPAAASWERRGGTRAEHRKQLTVAVPRLC